MIYPPSEIEVLTPCHKIINSNTNTSIIFKQVYLDKTLTVDVFYGVICDL